MAAALLNDRRKQVQTASPAGFRASAASPADGDPVQPMAEVPADTEPAPLIPPGRPFDS